MKTLWDAIFYNRGRGPSDGNSYWRRFTAAHYVYIGTALALLGAAVAMASLFIGQLYPGVVEDVMFDAYWEEPLILLLNTLPVLLLTAFFYFATGRAWAGFLGGAVIPLSLSVVCFYKMIIRSEVLVASDLGLVGEALEILPNYTIRLSGRPLLAIGLLLLGTVFTVFLMPGRLRNVWVRVGGTVLSAAAMAVLLFTVYFPDAVYEKVVNDAADINIWVEQQVFVSKGFLYSFLHSVPDAFPSAPEGYDAAAAQELLGRYPEGAIEDGRKVNVVAVMLEAYSDLSEYPQAGVFDQVYAPLRQLQAESLHGHVVANVFGGGTVDTERNFLTGYPDSEEYRGVTDSYVWFLRENGYRAEGYHSGDPWFYNRRNVELNLGMERFLFMTDFGSEDRSDDYFFARLHELIDGRDASAPYFNFSVTYQNHGAYADTFTGDTAYVQREGKDDPTYFTVNNYLTGVADTSRRMLDFVDSLRDDPEPFVVVFFGDHKPYLGTAYAAMGINMDVGTEEGFYNYYTTPYVIWANDAAKKATGGDFTGDGGDVSACFLMDKVFEACGWGRSAYGQLVHETAGTVSVIHTGADFSVVDGVLNHTLTGAGNEAVETLRQAAYYRKHNFPYKELVS